MVLRNQIPIYGKGDEEKVVTYVLDVKIPEPGETIKDAAWIVFDSENMGREVVSLSFHSGEPASLDYMQAVLDITRKKISRLTGFSGEKLEEIMVEFFGGLESVEVGRRQSPEGYHGPPFHSWPGGGR